MASASYVAGLGYLLPIILTIAIVGASYIGSGRSIGNIGVIALVLSIGLPVLVLLIRAVSARKDQFILYPTNSNTQHQSQIFTRRTFANRRDRCGDSDTENTHISVWH